MLRSLDQMQADVQERLSHYRQEAHVYEPVRRRRLRRVAAWLHRTARRLEPEAFAAQFEVDPQIEKGRI